MNKQGNKVFVPFIWECCSVFPYPEDLFYPKDSLPTYYLLSTVFLSQVATYPGFVTEKVNVVHLDPDYSVKAESL